MTKATYFAVRIPPSIFDFKKSHFSQQPFKKLSPHYTQHPFKNLVGYRLNFFINVDSRNVHHNSIIFLGFRSYPKMNISHILYQYWYTIVTYTTKRE